MKQSINIDSPFYCSAPASSLFIDPKGRISACCSGTEPYGSINDENSIEDIILSGAAKKLRQDVYEGLKASYCSGCYRSELMSNDSERNFFRNIDVTDPLEFKLKSLDVRWSTVCNFACIYCSEDWSSLWGKLKGLPGYDNSNIKKSEEVLDFIQKYGSKSIEQAILAGGEPLAQVQNNRLLDILPLDCDISIITNFGIDLNKSSIFNKLKSRDKVRWSISLENIGDKFEFVRQGGSWHTICNNIEIIKSQTNHKFHFLSVFNILSAWDIEEFTKFTSSVNSKISWQTIKDKSDILNPGYFSQDIKNILKKKLDSTNLDHNMYINSTFIKETLNYLDQEVTVEGINNKFLTYMNNHETNYNITGHNFKTLWPELYNILNK